MLSLVFYYGEDQDWDGALSLHDMLEFPEELKVYQKYFSDYQSGQQPNREQRQLPYGAAGSI